MGESSLFSYFYDAVTGPLNPQGHVLVWETRDCAEEVRLIGKGDLH